MVVALEVAAPCGVLGRERDTAAGHRTGGRCGKLHADGLERLGKRSSLDSSGWEGMGSVPIVVRGRAAVVLGVLAAILQVLAVVLQDLALNVSRLYVFDYPEIITNLLAICSRKRKRRRVHGRLITIDAELRRSKVRFVVKERVVVDACSRAIERPSHVLATAIPHTTAIASKWAIGAHLSTPQKPLHAEGT